MSHLMLPIEHYMSSVLVVIDPHQTIAEASRLMRLHSIRHLPVVDKSSVVGLLSQRDVYLIETRKDVDERRVTVDEAMTTELYTVEPDEPLNAVVRTMADKKLGAAVVTHGGKLKGLFTTTDALRALAVIVVDAEVPD